MHGSSLYVCASVYRCICMEVYVYVRVFIGVYAFNICAECSHTPDEKHSRVRELTGIAPNSRQQSKTVNIKAHFRNEQSCIDEFELKWCLFDKIPVEQMVERESVIYGYY